MVGPDRHPFSLPISLFMHMASQSFASLPASFFWNCCKFFDISRLLMNRRAKASWAGPLPRDKAMWTDEATHTRKRPNRRRPRKEVTDLPRGVGCRELRDGSVWLTLGLLKPSRHPRSTGITQEAREGQTVLSRRGKVARLFRRKSRGGMCSLC